MTRADMWFSPTSLLCHLSERCAKTQGRPAAHGVVDLVDGWNNTWCERCSPEEKRIGILEGSR